MCVYGGGVSLLLSLLSSGRLRSRQGRGEREEVALMFADGPTLIALKTGVLGFGMLSMWLKVCHRVSLGKKFLELALQIRTKTFKKTKSLHLSCPSIPLCRHRRLTAFFSSSFLLPWPLCGKAGGGIGGRGPKKGKTMCGGRSRKKSVSVCLSALVTYFSCVGNSGEHIFGAKFNGQWGQIKFPSFI